MTMGVWLSNEAVTKRTPGTLTVQWDWTPPAGGISPLSATVYISQTSASGPWEPGADALYVQGQTTGSCTVSGLNENTQYWIKVVELMSDLNTHQSQNSISTTTAANYPLSPNASVTQEWHVSDHALLRDNSLGTYIEARVSSEDNDVPQIYGFDNPNQDWGIKKLEVRLVAERDGSIDDLEVNVRIAGQAFAEPYFVALPLTFPPLTSPQVLTFEYGEWAGEYGGAWTRTQMNSLELILIAHGLGAGTHRVKIAEVTVKTFEEL
ncbi:MAG: hypothetical protein GHCLOJNM_01723 [bacterium]|nr:hypothetical protein [bacterium]